MTDASGRYTISYNGEVYNYRELKRELEARGIGFRSNCDTEVILTLYREQGVEAFAQLNGIFALAIWDAKARALILARDGMGVKPLYLCQTRSGFAFANEIKAFTALPDFDRTLDPTGALSYLTYLWTAGERTMLASVKKLAPGTWLKVGSSGRRSSGTFYSLPPPAPRSDLSTAGLIAGTERALRTAVDRQMLADVEVGAFLSGGLDSSSIVAFARDSMAGRRLQCFTIAHDEDASTAAEMNADLPYARRAAQFLGVDLHEVRADAFTASDFERLIYQLDEPQADPAALNSLHISALARRHGIKVLLSGSGGDDLFTGYRRHSAARWDWVWRTMPAGARRAVQAGGRSLGTGSATSRRVRKLLSTVGSPTDERLVRLFEWFPAEQAATLFSREARPDPEEVREPLLEALAEVERAPTVERVLRIDQKFFLTDHNLNYTDKTGMASGVEIRVPFLDPDLVAWSAGLPLHAKMRHGQTKWALRRAMERHLPREIIYRPKSGFGVPLRSWLRNEMRPMMEEMLQPRALADRGLFDPVAVNQLKTDTLEGRVDGSYTLLGLIAIELWAQRFAEPCRRPAAA
jgi:asparagine synthase (glutamine-hydrolysing)